MPFGHLSLSTQSSLMVLIILTFRSSLYTQIPNASPAPWLSFANFFYTFINVSDMTSLKFISKYFYFHLPSLLLIERTENSFSFLKLIRYPIFLLGSFGTSALRFFVSLFHQQKRQANFSFLLFTTVWPAACTFLPLPHSLAIGKFSIWTTFLLSLPSSSHTWWSSRTITL